MSELQVVLNKLEEMSSDIKEIKTDVADLKTKMEKVENKLEKVENRLEKVENRLEAVFEQTGGLIEFRHYTQKTLSNILEQQISITHVVGEHTVAIHTLQRRLNKQENDADTKDDITIKREPEVS